MPDLRKILEELAAGQRNVDDVLQLVRHPHDLEFARLDHDRATRCGFPEVIYCQGKTPEQVAQIFTRLADHHDRVLATRADPSHWDAVRSRVDGAEYHEAARAITWTEHDPERTGQVAIVAAGTSDVPVAEEARITASIMGARTVHHYDVGVAGLHRILAVQEDLTSSRAIVVVAGMEGALPSVVGGLVDRPVIAVPTSVGYGASFGGVAALLGMLNTCASGVSVVNIDNGFGAGYCAALINRVAATESSTDEGADPS